MKFDYSSACLTSFCIVLWLVAPACSHDGDEPPLINFGWTTTGLEGGFVSSVAFHPTNQHEIWASGDDGSGLFRSTDSAGRWTAVAGLPPDHSTYSLLFDPNDPQRLFAPNHFGRGVLRTMNSGGSWQVVGDGLPTASPDKKLHALVFDSIATSTVFACTAGGLFISSDLGTHFTPVSSATFAGETSFTAAVSSSSGVFVGTEGGRVFRTTDTGANWTEVTTASGIPISSIAATPSALYFSSLTGTVMKSTTFDTAGLTAVNLGGGSGAIDSGLWTKLAVIPGASAATDTIYVGTVFTAANALWGFHASFDGGNTFERRISGMEDQSVFSIAVDPFDDMRIIVGTVGGGAYITNDAGLTWKPRSDGLLANAVLGIAQDANNSLRMLATSTEGLNGTPGVYETLDGGSDWSPIPAPPNDALSLHIPTADSNRLLIGGFNGDGIANPGIQLSLNGSAGPWTPVLSTQVRIERFVETSTRIFAFASDTETPAGVGDLGLYASADLGSTWTLTANLLATNMAPHPFDPEHSILVGTDAWASLDSFTSGPISLGLNATFPGQIFTSVAFVSHSEVLVGSNTGKLYRTINYDPTGMGVHWTEIPTPANDVLLRDIWATSGDWFLSCWTGDLLALPSSTPGILHSSDQGSTWAWLKGSQESSTLAWTMQQSIHDSTTFYVALWGGGIRELKQFFYL